MQELENLATLQEPYASLLSYSLIFLHTDIHMVVLRWELQNVQFISSHSHTVFYPFNLSVQLLREVFFIAVQISPEMKTSSLLLLFSILLWIFVIV